MAPRKSVPHTPTTSSDPQQITIQPLKVERAVLHITSLSPLIMHAWSAKAIKQIEDKQQMKTKTGKVPRDPQQDFEDARYKINKSQDGIPALCVKNCIVEAGVMADIPKTTLRKCIFVLPTHARQGEEENTLLPIICPSGPRLKQDMVKIAMGTADVRYRPIYHGWECKVPVEFIASRITLDQLVNLLDRAGYSVGLGEWRPQKNGTYGRFRVEKVEEQ